MDIKKHFNISGGWALLLVIATIIVGIFSTVAGLFMLLWNWLMPLIFGLTVLSFSQACGVVVMISVVSICLRSYD